jgi:DNA replication protein DnaC
MLSVDRQTGVLDRIANVRLGTPFVTDDGSRDGHSLSIAELAYLHTHPEHAMNQLVEVDCPGRPNPDFGDPKNEDGPRFPCKTAERFQCRALFAAVTACDECRRDAEESDLVRRAKHAWEKLCPALYRDTKRSHEHFPKAQYEAVKDYTGERSYVFFGPSGSGKTRLAFMLLKRAMLKGKTVGVMFDEQLQDAKSSRERMKAVEQWGGFHVLLLDDSLMNGAQDEHTASFLKSLLDYIMRRKSHVIITTQITKAEYTEQLRKWESSRKTTRTDEERSLALLRRVSEMCGEPVEFHAIPGTETVSSTPGRPGQTTLDADQPF